MSNSGDEEITSISPKITGKRERVSIGSLLPPSKLLRSGESTEHIRALAETEETLPPIVVHRETRRVIDGMHRLRAARFRGDELIEVVFVDGSSADVFVLAVELNRAHGLPLTMAERKSAAARIMDSHPHWSDRKIARTTGLAASTIASLRSSSISGTVERRTGQDGRIRPNDGTGGRQRASDLLAQNPNASVREVAKIARISVGTASDVRARLRRGEPAVTARQQAVLKLRPAAATQRTSPDYGRVLQSLRKDPSLRFTDVGRRLLRLLDGAAPGSVEQIAQIADSVPEHCRIVVVDMARECAAAWQHLADQLAGRDTA
ncbi:ParB/RepB/Spo0J family partition protein [Streptomyces roseochromogenus]|uniref:Regulatory protein cloG n=1 Tax=Streptomyces roseochromogenus subsp. oscitans TaxID=149682 RepID=Q8GHC9_STRRC|nr:ParB N-terminal domain-containing protein [Streptomyces roseochromogenus]AAN65222.1 regulatory protein cloG [Streptomyces roseochromogenus subsp. oscitans DS 12.976]